MVIIIIIIIPLIAYYAIPCTSPVTAVVCSAPVCTSLVILVYLCFPKLKIKNEQKKKDMKEETQTATKTTTRTKFSHTI